MLNSCKLKDAWTDALAERVPQRKKLNPSSYPSCWKDALPDDLAERLQKQSSSNRKTFNWSGDFHIEGRYRFIGREKLNKRTVDWTPTHILKRYFQCLCSSTMICTLSIVLICLWELLWEVMNQLCVVVQHKRWRYQEFYQHCPPALKYIPPTSWISILVYEGFDHKDAWRSRIVEENADKEHCNYLSIWICLLQPRIISSKAIPDGSHVCIKSLFNLCMTMQGLWQAQIRD